MPLLPYVVHKEKRHPPPLSHTRAGVDPSTRATMGISTIQPLFGVEPGSAAHNMAVLLQVREPAWAVIVMPAAARNPALICVPYIHPRSALYGVPLIP